MHTRLVWWGTMSATVAGLAVAMKYTYIGELSKPDSNRASCITPSSLPRQMIPSGSSFLAASNQLFQSYLRKHSQPQPHVLSLGQLSWANRAKAFAQSPLHN